MSFANSRTEEILLASFARRDALHPEYVGTPEKRTTTEAKHMAVIMILVNLALDAPHLGFSPEGKEFRERFTLMLTLLAPELFKGENLKAYNSLKSIMVQDILDVRKETK